MRKSFFLFFISFLVTGILTIPGKLIAQTDSTSTTTDSTATAEEEEEVEDNTISPLIAFTSTQMGDNSVNLKTIVQARINGTLTKLAGIKIEFTLGDGDTETKLGEVMTNSRGVAILNCKPDQLKADAEGKLNFKAAFAGKDSLEAAEEEISVKRARLEITPVKEDSTYSVSIKLVDISSGTEEPVAETTLGVFVQRLFSPLKIGEGDTDESGEVSVDIPNDLPGDAKGNLTLLAKLDDNETYGNLEASVVQQWGVPVSDVVKKLPRALWSPSPPLWMLITFIILMTAVWGHYIVIIFELFRLRKEEPAKSN